MPAAPAALQMWPPVTEVITIDWFGWLVDWLIDYLSD